MKKIFNFIKELFNPSTLQVRIIKIVENDRILLEKFVYWNVEVKFGYFQWDTVKTHLQTEDLAKEYAIKYKQNFEEVENKIIYP